MVLEILLSAAIIIALLLFMGVSIETILSVLAVILMGAIVLAAAGFVLFFLITDISLLFRKRVKGKFLYVNEDGRYDRAVYEYGEQKYMCLFPAETLGRNRIYKENAEYMLLIPKSGKITSAFDRHSLFIITIGSVVSVLFAVLLYFGIRFMLTLF